jgi:hypothetical protein
MCQDVARQVGTGVVVEHERVDRRRRRARRCLRRRGRDNAECQAQHGSERDGGSDAHMRECMTATR